MLFFILFCGHMYRITSILVMWRVNFSEDTKCCILYLTVIGSIAKLPPSMIFLPNTVASLMQNYEPIKAWAKLIKWLYQSQNFIITPCTWWITSGTLWLIIMWSTYFCWFRTFSIIPVINWAHLSLASTRLNQHQSNMRYVMLGSTLLMAVSLVIALCYTQESTI